MAQGAEGDLKDIRYYTNTSKVDFVTDNEPVEDLNDNALIVDAKAIAARTLADQVEADFTTHQGSGDTSHGEVTTSVAGFMSPGDKAKIIGVQQEAQINILSPVDALALVSGNRISLHSHISVTTVNDGFMTAAIKTKLNTVKANANVNNVSDVDADLLARSPGVDANSLHTHTTPTLVETFKETGPPFPAHDDVDHTLIPGVSASIFNGFSKRSLKISDTMESFGITVVDTFIEVFPFKVEVVDVGWAQLTALSYYGWGSERSRIINIDITHLTPSSSQVSVTWGIDVTFPGAHSMRQALFVHAFGE